MTNTTPVKFRASALNSMCSKDPLFRIKGFLSNLELNNPELFKTLKMPPSFVNKENAFMRSGIEFEKQTLDDLGIEPQWRGMPFVKEFTHSLLNDNTGILSGTIDAAIEPEVLLRVAGTQNILQEKSPDFMLLQDFSKVKRRCILEIKRVHSQARFDRAQEDYLTQCAVYEHLFSSPLFMFIAYEDPSYGMKYKIVSPHKGSFADPMTTEKFIEKVNHLNSAVQEYVVQEKMLISGSIDDNYFASIKGELENLMIYQPAVENAKQFTKLMLLNHEFGEESICHSGMIFSKSELEDSRYLTAAGKRYLLESGDADKLYPLKKRHPTYKFKVNGQDWSGKED